MTQPDRCPECGAERSAGICPRRLIRLGIEDPAPDCQRLSSSGDAKDLRRGEGTTAGGVVETIAGSI
jgi:hypothetical protein